MSSLRSTLLTYVTLWQRSFTDTSVYRVVWRFSLRFALGYLFCSYLILGLINTAIFQWRTVPVIKTFTSSMWEQLKTQWPEDLRLTIEEEQISSSTNPVLVPFPSVLTQTDGLPEQLAVIDTTTANAEALNPDNLPNALLVLTQQELVLQTPDQPNQALPWNLFTADLSLPTELNKTSVHAAEGTVLAVRDTVLVQLTMLAFMVSAFLLPLARLFLLLMYAWLAQAVFWFTGNKVVYGRAYRIGMYLLPVAELVLIVWRGLYPQTPLILSFWWIWLLALTVIAVTNRNGQINQVVKK